MTRPLGPRKPVSEGQGTFWVFQSYGNNTLWKEGGKEEVMGREAGKKEKKKSK